MTTVHTPKVLRALQHPNILLKILKLEDFIKLETAPLVFKIKNKTLPAQFYNHINKVDYISKKSIRANTKKNYFTPFFVKQNHKDH